MECLQSGRGRLIVIETYRVLRTLRPLGRSTVLAQTSPSPCTLDAMLVHFRLRPLQHITYRGSVRAYILSDTFHIAHHQTTYSSIREHEHQIKLHTIQSLDARTQKITGIHLTHTITHLLLHAGLLRPVRIHLRRRIIVCQEAHQHWRLWQCIQPRLYLAQ